MSIQKFNLSNGVRVLAEPIDYVSSASIGLWCKTGSRHETGDEAGITHFIEHMLFKGTPSRTSRQIAEEIEGRGGVINAFTDKEMTCYYVRVLAGDYKVAIDVLSDMLLNSLLDPEELEREKGVVLKEIQRCQDEPSDYVHELQLQGRWGDHPLGKPVIGTEESVSGFDRLDLVNYMQRQYRAENIVLSFAGKVDPASFLKVAEEKLQAFQPGGAELQATKVSASSSKREISRDVEQVHFCIGTDSCSLFDDELYTAAVLDGILGGGMSSRLFQEVRERRGLAYAIGSYNLNYSSAGVYTVYGGTSKQAWDEVQEIVRDEFDKIMKDGPSEQELQKVKRNISGNMVLALEGMSARMMRMTKNELHHRREIPVEETLAKIEAVSTSRVIEFARQILVPEKVSTTAIGPF